MTRTRRVLFAMMMSLCIMQMLDATGLMLGVYLVSFLVAFWIGVDARSGAWSGLSIGLLANVFVVSGFFHMWGKLGVNGWDSYFDAGVVIVLNVLVCVGLGVAGGLSRGWLTQRIARVQAMRQ